MMLQGELAGAYELLLSLAMDRMGADPNRRVKMDGQDRDASRPRETGGPTAGTDAERHQNGEGWDSVVSAASDHAREKIQAMAAEPERASRRGRGYLLLALALVLGGVVAWNLQVYFQAGTPSRAFQETALQASIFMAQQAVEGSLAETGTLPSTLESVGADEEGLTYAPSGPDYRLTATYSGLEVVYRSGDDIQPFREAFQSLLAGEVER